MRKVADESLSCMSRAVRKPLMEKRRRARMNDCLETLKNILLKTSSVTIKRSQIIPSKLDKADILELTVNLMQELLSQTSDYKSVDQPKKTSQGSSSPWRPW